MYCQQCNQQPATVHITKIINGQKTEMQLCSECAAKMKGGNFGWQSPFTLNLLGSLFEDPDASLGAADKSAAENGYRCHTCGQTYAHFRHTGKLGCSRCYNTFVRQLAPVIRRIHGSEKHTGKIPQRTGEKLKLKKEINELKATLRQLVEREEFEQAAEVRDRIRRLEGKDN